MIVAFYKRKRGTAIETEFNLKVNKDITKKLSKFLFVGGKFNIKVAYEMLFSESQVATIFFFNSIDLLIFVHNFAYKVQK